MRRKEPVAAQVFRHLYPRPEPSVDPTSWHHHVKNHLVGEIRHCTRNFYGEHESIEARYPGLDYNAPHIQRRLSRYSHHRKLFQTFKALGLTPFEIYELCNWEGTLFVQRRFEREHGRRVMDTTGDDIPVWVEPQRRFVSQSGAHVQPPQIQLAADDEAEMLDADEDDDEEDEEAGELHGGEFEQYGNHDEATTRGLDENKSDGEESEEESEQAETASASFTQNLTTMSTRQLDQMLLEQQRARQRTLVTMQSQLQNQRPSQSRAQHTQLQGFQTYQQPYPSSPTSPRQSSRAVRSPTQILQQRRQQQHLQQQQQQPQYENYLPSSPLSRHTSVANQPPAAPTGPPLDNEQIQAHLDYLRDNVRRISTPGSGFNIDETFRYLESRGVPWDLLMRTVNDALFQHTQEPSVRS